MKDRIQFHLDGKHNRIASDWGREPGSSTHRSIRPAARRHAARHGAAGMWFASDKFTLFYKDFDGKVRQKSWKRGVPLDCSCH